MYFLHLLLVRRTMVLVTPLDACRAPRLELEFSRKRAVLSPSEMLPICLGMVDIKVSLMLVRIAISSSKSRRMWACSAMATNPAAILPLLNKRIAAIWATTKKYPLDILSVSTDSDISKRNTTSLCRQSEMQCQNVVYNPLQLNNKLVIFMFPPNICLLY